MATISASNTVRRTADGLYTLQNRQKEATQIWNGEHHGYRCAWDLRPMHVQ